MLRAQGDLSGALAAFREDLEIARRLAAGSPSSVQAQRDLWVSMWRLASFPDSGVTWAQIVSVMEDMNRRGTLLPSDRPYLEHARRNAKR